MTRERTLAHLERVGLVPVVRAPSPELAIRAVEALLLGGIDVFEITMTVPNAVSVIRTLCDRFAGRALVGAGTVLCAEDARLCIDAGAAFIVSPGLEVAIVQASRDCGVAVMPGALTPTEIMAATRAGADMVKIFPCSAMGGAKYLRALKAPFPHVKLLPTGGVSAATAGEYIAAGASALGIGADLIDISAIAAGNHAVLTRRAQALVEAVDRAREKLQNSPAT
jgi:2-dehydro-3-deoxyphosphogluconate aldolase/(4S)-4-hydroxy-2-oxoglutarate aldolase